MQKIIHFLNIKSPIDKAYEAVATINGLSNWWSEKVKGSDQEGGIIEFRFIDVFNPHMKVISSKKPKQVKWTCVDGHEPWKNNEFTFELSEGENGTNLKFTQEYSKPVSEEDYGTYNFNWAYYLQSLQEYCATGKGKPFSPD